MKVLNDEERNKAYYYTDSYPLWDLDEAIKNIAKAQLQADMEAFIEWLKEREMLDYRPYEEGGEVEVYSHIKRKDVESLEQLVKVIR